MTRIQAGRSRVRLSSPGLASPATCGVFVAAVVLASLAGTQPDTDHDQRVADTIVDYTSASADTVSFAEDVLPIFVQRCGQCHGAPGEDGEPVVELGLNLLEYERVMMGSEFGPVIEAGDADSYLLEMIVAGDMPQEGDPVPEEEIQIIRAWIVAGAPNN